MQRRSSALQTVSGTPSTSRLRTMHASEARKRSRRPLKCSSGVHPPPAPAEGRASCRICFDAQHDGDELVAPCLCSGSMVRFSLPLSAGAPPAAAASLHSSPSPPLNRMQRYVHTACLARWQHQLQQQRGLRASRRCDVCHATWLAPHAPPSLGGGTTWRLMLRDAMSSVPWHSLAQVKRGAASLSMHQLTQSPLRRAADCPTRLPTPHPCRAGSLSCWPWPLCAACRRGWRVSTRACSGWRSGKAWGAAEMLPRSCRGSWGERRGLVLAALRRQRHLQPPRCRHAVVCGQAYLDLKLFL